MTTSQAITWLYVALFLVVAPVTVYTVIAAYMVRRWSWWLLALSNIGMLVALFALIVQRSTPDQAIKNAMTIVQRFGIVTWIIGATCLTVYLMWLENGRLAAVRDAMTLAPVRRCLHRLWKWGDDGTGTVADCWRADDV